MKAKDRLADLGRLDSGALGEELGKLKKEQFNLRFQKASGQLANTGRVRIVRRDIARIQTLQRAKAAEAAPKA